MEQSDGMSNDFPYDDLKPWQEKYNITTGIDGDAHFACDYRIGL